MTILWIILGICLVSFVLALIFARLFRGGDE